MAQFWRKSVMTRYALVLVCVSAAAAIAALVLVLGIPRPTISFAFLFAILISAWIGGFGPGILAGCLSLLSGQYLLQPNFTLGQLDLNRLVLVLLVSNLVSYIAAQRRRTEDALRAANAELDSRVQEQTRELNEALRALGEREERQRRAAEAGKVGLWEWDILRNEVTWSDQIYEMHGLAKGTFGGTVESFAGLIHPLDQPQVSKALDEALTGLGAYDVEFRPVRPDGQHRWLSTTGRVTFDAAGRAVFMHGAVVDTTERREAEEALRRSNEELEEFASVASHDLQEPIRQVAIFSELVKAQYGDRLDDEGRKYLDYCVSGALRMRALINDLLDYSSKSRAEQPSPEPVDLESVVTAVRASLRNRLEETGGRVEVSALPTILGHRSLLTQLWQNLMANALTYRGENAPVVRLWAERDQHGWMFSVADNGLGIAPEYHEQIFRIFQRLHDRERFPGTGIGLAICKKIVERHGGRIWVESEPGKGSTFRFTLPDTLPTKEGAANAFQHARD